MVVKSMICFGKTDIGMKRSSNQDAFSVVRLSSDALLCVICDGMGGANGGNIASRTAIDAFSDYVSTAISQPDGENGTNGENDASKNETETEEPPRGSGINYSSLLAAAADAANTAVIERAKKNASLSGMGTTLVAALVIGNRLYAVNVGDSRLYILKEGRLTQITRDHSYVQYLVDIGIITADEAAVSPYKNVITRAIGREEKSDADVYSVVLPEDGGFYLILCSDGLYNFVTGDRLAEVIGKNGDETLEQKTGELVDIANRNGGGDNISVILIKG